MGFSPTKKPPPRPSIRAQPLIAHHAVRLPGLFILKAEDAQNPMANLGEEGKPEKALGKNAVFLLVH